MFFVKKLKVLYPFVGLYFFSFLFNISCSSRNGDHQINWMLISSDNSHSRCLAIEELTNPYAECLEELKQN